MNKPTPEKDSSQYPNRPRINKESTAPPYLFKLAYWTFLTSVFVLLSVVLFKPLFVSNAGNHLFQVQHIALAVVAVCFGLWIGDSVKFIRLPTDVRKAVFMSFVVVILTAAASYAAAAFNTPFNPKLSIDVVILDESKVTENSEGKYIASSLQNRPNEHYVIEEGERLRILVGITASNFTLLEARKNDIQLSVFFNAESPLWDLGVIKQTDPEDWKNYPMVKALSPSIVKQKLKVGPSDTVFLLHLRIQPEAIKSGAKSGKIRMLIRDRLNGMSAEWDKGITIEQKAVNPT